MEAFDLARYASVSFREKEEVYKNSYEVYKSLRTKQQDHKLLERDSLIKLKKYLKSVKPITQRKDCLNLIRWYCAEFEKLGLQDKENYSKYLTQKVSLILYFISSFQEILTGVRKEFSEAGQLLSKDLNSLVQDMTSFIETFVIEMDRKREKENKEIKERLQVELKTQQLKISVLETNLKEKTFEIESHRSMIHTLRTKLSSNYFLLHEMNRDLEYSKDYGRIMESENKRLTQALEQLDEQMKDNEKGHDLIRQMLRQYEKELKSIREEREKLEKRRREEAELFTNKQRFELMKLMEDHTGIYDNFRTYTKETVTDDLNAPTEVSLCFKIIPSKIKKVHRRIQTVRNVQDAEIQCDFNQGSFRSQNRSSDNDQKATLTLDLKTHPQSNIVIAQSNQAESDTIGWSPKLEKRKLSKQRSMAIGENGVKENHLGSVSHFAKAAHANIGLQIEEKIDSDEDNRFASKDRLSISVMSRHEEMIKSKTFIQMQMAEEASERNSLDRSLSRDGEKNPDSNFLSPDNKLFKNSGRKSKKLFDNLTMVNNKSARSMNRSATSKQQIDGSEKSSYMGYENMRENQLRNELIKLKQLLLTWNYKLVNHSKDLVKSKEIQSNIDQITQEIEAIEVLIKSQKKSTGLETITLKLPLEKKNTGTVASILISHRITKKLRPPSHQSRAEAKQLYHFHGKQNTERSQESRPDDKSNEEQRQRTAESDLQVLLRVRDSVRKEPTERRLYLPHDATSIQHVQDTQHLQLERQSSRKAVSERIMISP